MSLFFGTPWEICTWFMLCGVCFGIKWFPGNDNCQGTCFSVQYDVTPLKFTCDIMLLCSLAIHLSHVHNITYFHFEAEAKRLPFCRRHFQVQFLEWKLLNFKSNFTEICSLGSNWQYGTIGSDNGLAPNRQQVIIWANVGMLYWCIYASLGLNELSIYSLPKTHCKLISSHLHSWYVSTVGGCCTGRDAFI